MSVACGAPSTVTCTCQVTPARSCRPGGLAVVDQAAVVDQRDPLGELGDLGHVVRGEQHGAAAAVHLVAEELADLLLDHDVHADRRLVEEDDRRVVQQRGGQVAADPLAERELPGPGLPELLELEDAVELGDPRLEVGVAQTVDVAEHLQGGARRQVAPQLGALAEDHADPPGVGDPVAVRDDAVDLDGARGRGEDAAEHLDGGRLAGAVRAEQREKFARLDAEADAPDRGLGRRAPAG